MQLYIFNRLFVLLGAQFGTMRDTLVKVTTRTFKLNPKIEQKQATFHKSDNFGHKKSHLMRRKLCTEN